MLQAVEQGIDEGFTLELFVPLREVEICRDDGADAVIAPVEQVEEGVGLLGVNAEVAELIDDEDGVSGEAVEEFGGGTVGERGVEFVDEFLNAQDTVHQSDRLTGHQGSATYIAIHFDRFELAPGHRLEIRSESGRQRHVLTGRGRHGLGTFWASHVKGDVAVVELFTTGRQSNSCGVSIDKYAAGTAVCTDKPNSPAANPANDTRGSARTS